MAKKTLVQTDSVSKSSTDTLPSNHLNSVFLVKGRGQLIILLKCIDFGLVILLFRSISDTANNVFRVKDDRPISCQIKDEKSKGHEYWEILLPEQPGSMRN